MVEMDESFFRGVAGKFGLSLQFVYKDYKLMELVSEIITANAEMNLPIVMKGGTALNKIYFDEVQRFSEDIDFDLNGYEKKIPEFIKKIKRFSVEGPWRFKDVVRYHCTYDFIGQKDHIRLEFNIGKKTETAEPVLIKPITSALFGITHLGVNCYSFDDLVARKLNALLTRCEGKDVWDCYHALPKTKNIKKSISKFIGKEGDTNNFLIETVNVLKKSDPKQFAKTTNQYIPLSFRPKSWQAIVKTLISQIELL